MPTTTYEAVELTADPPNDADGYAHDRLSIATLLRAYRPTMTEEQWRTVLRFWRARGDDAELPPHLVQP